MINASRGHGVARHLTVSFLVCAFLLAGCASSGTATTKSSGRPVAVGHDEVGSASSAASLDKLVEIGFYQPTSLNQIFEEIARVYFASRFETSLTSDASFIGEISQRPLREVLDEFCAESRCAWTVAGEPATLVLANHNVVGFALYQDAC